MLVSGFELPRRNPHMLTGAGRSSRSSSSTRLAAWYTIATSTKAASTRLAPTTTSFLQVHSMGMYSRRPTGNFPTVLSKHACSRDDSIHAITSRLNPVKPVTPPTVGGLSSRPEPSSGLEVLETENFRMQCFNTLTGTKFLVFTDTTQTNVDVTIRRIYDLYSDYVMKNPFYSLEMPIRCDMFERKLSSYIREINSR